MSETRPSPFVRLLPSLTDVAFIMPLVFLFARLGGAKYLLSDGDTGWHIRAGEWMIAHRHIVEHDIFSFSKSGQPWFAWEWLWDVMYGWLHLQFGMAAVVIGSMILISLTFLLLFRLVSRGCPNPFLSIAVTIAAAAGSSLHWLARPHLFTLLFVVLFLSVLERARDGKVRLMIILPVLTIPWANLHGGFFVGIILIGCYAAGEIASALLESDPADRRSALRRSRPYFLAAAGCAAASLVNPYTYHLHVHMYGFLSGTFHLQNIQEYESTSFQGVLARWYEPMVLVGVGAAVWCLYRRRFAHAFLLLGWVHLGMFSVRNLPIYLLVAAPFVAIFMHEVLLQLADAPVVAWVRDTARSFVNYAAEFGELDRLPRLYLPSVLSAVLVSAFFWAPAPPETFRAEYDPKNYPARALAALRDPQSAGNVFTNDEWGDYLIYRLYPSTKVFVDGRFDFYGEKFSQKYLDLMNVKYGWDATLNHYSIATVLVPVESSLAGALKESRGWRVVFDDGVAVVFRRSASGVRPSLAEGERSSAVICDVRSQHDRTIVKLKTSDPRITKTNTRSEPL